MRESIAATTKPRRRRENGPKRRQRMRSCSAALSVLCASVVTLSAGCNQPGVIELQRENSKLKDTISQKDHDLVAQQTQIQELNQQLAVVRAFKPDDLQKIFYPEKLQIDSLTGGENYDAQPGDDGVTVYLKPIDRDGDVIKVAGDRRIW